MTVKVYNSLNYPALKISGMAMTLINVLDEILLNSGWTKPFTGTMKAVYRSGVGSNQRYYYVNDSGLATGGFRNAGLRGYSVMTGATDAGTNPFPTTAQASQGVVIRKSNTLDTVAREWYAIVTEKLCYLFIASGEVAGVYNPYAFGDFTSYKALETRNSLVSGYEVDATTFTPGNYGILKLESVLAGTPGATYLAGDCNNSSAYDRLTGRDGSKAAMFHTDVFKGGTASSGGNLTNIISASETKDVRLGKTYIVNNDGTTNMLRGELPGYFNIMHNLTARDNKPIYENIYINGVLQTNRSFVLINTTANNMAAWEISNY